MILRQDWQLRLDRKRLTNTPVQGDVSVLRSPLLNADTRPGVEAVVEVAIVQFITRRPVRGKSCSANPGTLCPAVPTPRYLPERRCSQVPQNMLINSSYPMDSSVLDLVSPRLWRKDLPYEAPIQQNNETSSNARLGTFVPLWENNRSHSWASGAVLECPRPDGIHARRKYSDTTNWRPHVRNAIESQSSSKS